MQWTMPLSPFFENNFPWGFPGNSVVRNPPANAGDAGLTPGLGRSPGEENGNPVWYSFLENSMDRGAWQATVMGLQRVGVTFTQTQPQTKFEGLDNMH